MRKESKRTVLNDTLNDVPLRASSPTNDKGDDVQNAFRYQNAYGVLLLACAAAGEKPYCAIWCEHHEDLLGERHDGRFDAYQIKTKAPHTGLWKVSNDALVKSLRRFCELEQQHGTAVASYSFVSNCQVYIPTDKATDEKAIQESPLRFIEAAKAADTEGEIASPYLATYSKLKLILGPLSAQLFQVINKLHIVPGPSLDDYEDVLVARYIPRFPKCNILSTPELSGIRDELIQKVWEASSNVVNSTSKYTSAIGPDGKTSAEMRSKRISLDDVAFVFNERDTYVFRYSSESLEVSYSEARSKMGVLKKKMDFGGVGNHFDYMEAKAIAAQARLMEQANMAPEQSLQTLGHLEKVVLSECHEANIEVATNPANERGIKMLGNVVGRFRSLAKEEKEKIENQPYEVLVGLAGLLSGECKVWWGLRPPKEGE